MNIDKDLQKQLVKVFGLLNNEPACKSFPPPAFLSEYFTKDQKTIKADLLRSYFGTVAVDIWHRSVHSFLISTSLVDVSPVWSSVSGYYSSHYTVRGIAHLLGYFYSFNTHKLIRVDFTNPKGYSMDKPRGLPGAEHLLYWELVKSNPLFDQDPLFTKNQFKTNASDSSHRNFANYTDHLCRYPIFSPLEKDSIKHRIDQLSKIELVTVPIPDRSKFPDLEAVQLIAYHRIISFRNILDEVLGGSNKFWNLHRNPAFARDYLDYQVTARNRILAPSDKC